MIKATHWITALLGLLTLIFIGWNLADNNNTYPQTPINTSQPTYQSKQTSTVVYAPDGRLNYKLMADYIQHFAAMKITWFTQPTATMFDENKVPSWMIKADRAKLTHDSMLYLYGNVQVNNLTDLSYLKNITINNAAINLISQDLSSDEEVTLYGTSFNSTGMKMRGNLRNQTAKLIKNVKTLYYIQNSKTTYQSQHHATRLMLANAQTQELNTNNQQPIYINSDQQTVDMITNTLTLTSQVIVKCGSINIRADKVVITRPDGKNGHEVVEGYGKPVTFYQLQDDGKSVHGQSLKVRYETANDLIILTGNAYLEQLDSNVKSDRITYLVKKQQIEALSDKGKRVTTVLLPAKRQHNDIRTAKHNQN
ncbi:MAG: Lipopolysaccharide export system protein LptC [Sodalis sp. Fle]|nr:MAG: Lipopolysaccharide export system protein LptC [Sodalis sp. Fle]